MLPATHKFAAANALHVPLRAAQLVYIGVNSIFLEGCDGQEELCYNSRDGHISLLLNFLFADHPRCVLPLQFCHMMILALYSGADTYCFVPGASAFRFRYCGTSLGLVLLTSAWQPLDTQYCSTGSLDAVGESYFRSLLTDIGDGDSGIDLNFFLGDLYGGPWGGFAPCWSSPA